VRTISVVIIILVLIIITLVVYNLAIYKKIKTYSNTNEQINNLKVLQDFMDTIGKDDSVDNKLKTINDILIEKFAIKYSTIVVFNGAEYELKASNVAERFWDNLKNLHKEEMFKDSIMTAIPKYVTINSPDERLVYQRMEMSRAKAAMFFPLYIDNIYIGYWIIESDIPHAFDNMDTSILGIIRENVISVLKTVAYQKTIENIYRIDKVTGLKSAEYLYGAGKRTIDKFAQTSICMFQITNIEEINEKYTRQIGTQMILEIANLVKTNISSEYIFVRYMGPKFAIAFSGAEEEAVVDFVRNLKEKIENIKIGIEIKKSKKKLQVSPKINSVIATYYKGTGIEEVTKRLEEYLDQNGKEENAITCI